MAKEILIIDDEPDMLLIIQKRLHMEGYSTLTASSGSSALKTLVSEKPDLILLDVKMPDMDGYTLFHELKKNQQTAKIPVIIITAMDKMKSLFSSEGICEYLVKPFGVNELLSVVHRSIGVA